AARVIGGDHQARFRVLQIFVGYSLKTFFRVGDGVHTTLLHQLIHGVSRLPLDHGLDGVSEPRISLPHALIEATGAHPAFLHLSKGPARVDRLVLTDVADQKDAVLRSEALEKIMDLTGARKTRFVEYKKLTLPGFARGPLQQEFLQRRGLDAGFI